MDELLKAGVQLENRFRITDVLGHSEASAAYLAADLDQGGAWTLVWQSLEMFRMARKPDGALQYLTQDECHYLILRLEGQDLGLIFQAAGVLEECWAALWMAQVCDGIGRWHTKVGDDLVCLRRGDIRLGHLRLTATGRALLPTIELLSRPLTAVVAAQNLAFSAPEKGAGARLTARSDVYALGAVLYCLLTGLSPSDPKALAEGLVPPRKVRSKISGRMEKLILKAVDPDPNNRQETALQLSFELDRCIPRRLRRHRIGEF
jgi:serine/threonine-protein kinase